MPKFAANLTMMFNEWTFLDRFERAADAGFKAVEYLFPYAEAPEAITGLLHRHGLTQALFNAPPGDWAAGERGLAALPDRNAEFRASIATALAYVAAIGVKRLHVMSGNADARAAENRRAFEESLRFACDAAAMAGIDIVIEPINRRDMPGYFLNDFGYAVETIQRLGLPNLKLQYDIYHRQILHGDVLKSLEQMMPWIGHIQTASVPGRNEPGTGELNDSRIFEAIDLLGYQGYVGCEYRPAKGTLEGLGWLRNAEV
jgi:hydroxypyruvate isomerase